MYKWNLFIAFIITLAITCWTFFTMLTWSIYRFTCLIAIWRTLKRTVFPKTPGFASYNPQSNVSIVIKYKQLFVYNIILEKKSGFLQLLQRAPIYPSWHPPGHTPLMWSHGSLLSQWLLQRLVQFSPYKPDSHPDFNRYKHVYLNW